MIRVQAEDFDVGIELSKMTDENFGIGAQSCFIGLVRDMANEEHISAMTLEHLSLIHISEPTRPY